MEDIISQNQDDGLSIIIENIEFTLIYKVTTYETGIYEEIYKSPPAKDETSRIVKIKSVNLSKQTEEFFWVYLSFSELGVWRFLCYENLETTRYDKGKEYIQSTCVNMYLQQHLHLWYDRLEEITIPHDDIINISRSQPGFISITHENIKLTQEYINKNLPILHDSNREKFFIPSGNLPIKCGFTVNYPEQSVIRQIQSVSQYLQNSYTILDYEEMFHYNFIFRDVINSENIVVKVTLKHKNTNQTIILFYKKMVFSKLESKTPVPGVTRKKQEEFDMNIDSITNPGNVHFVVILVIPSEARCLDNSLYSEYINLGVYVCKPFDYTRLLNSKLTQCTKDYSYVGYRYQNIFPIKNVENLLSTKEKKNVLGGKMSKRKNNNNRKSKKNKKTKRKYRKKRKSTKKNV